MAPRHAGGNSRGDPGGGRTFRRTLGKWNGVDAGFDTRNLLVVQVNPESLGYNADASAALTERLVARIATLPGVTRVTSSGPFWTNRWFGMFFIEGERQLRRHGVPRWLSVRHDFFVTLGMPVIAGRVFRPDEDTAVPRIAVVDGNLARRYFGSVSPIGRRVAFRKGDPDIEIVGVVGNLWIPGTRPEDVSPTIYLPARTRQSDFDPEGDRLHRTAYGASHETSLEIRTAVDPASVVPAIRTAIEEIEPALPLIDPKTLEDGIRQRLEPTRVASLIWLSFGSVVLALTAVGLYGILSYGIARRTREIGIRTALGADRRDIMRLVTGQVSTLVAVGLAIGLMASMAVNQLVRAFIFGVTFYDVPTLAAVLAVMLGVTGAAAFLPARRAARIDPTVALRWE